MQTHSSYPSRVDPNADNYEQICPYFVHPHVKENEGVWADKPSVDEEELRTRPTWFGTTLQGTLEHNTLGSVLEFQDGRPLFPRRTGIKDRGMLGRYGPNHAADPIVTRYGPHGKLQFVAIKRSDNGQWAIPGGMFDPDESRHVTLRREFKEEAASKCDEDVLDRVFASERIVYAGIVWNDPRNTDHAWMETIVCHYHIEDPAVAALITLEPQPGETLEVKWMDCDVPTLYASHKDYIDLVVSQMESKHNQIQRRNPKRLCKKMS